MQVIETLTETKTARGAVVSYECGWLCAAEEAWHVAKETRYMLVPVLARQ